MNGYLLLGNVIVSHVLPVGTRNPFTFASSHQYKYINWKRLFALKTSAVSINLSSQKLRKKLP
jgi:hypothetical protein